MEEEFTHTGAYVMGRGMFDSGEPRWGDNPPFHAPVFILTHHARESEVKRDGTSFTFVTDGVESAIRQAKAAVGGKNVFVSGGASTVQQAIAAGLLENLEIHLVPVLLGNGVRLFETLGNVPIELGSTRVGASSGVTHLKFHIKTEN